MREAEATTRDDPPWQTLQRAAVQARLPFNVTFETTYGCNLNCVHCFNPTHKTNAHELSTDEIKRVLSQLAAAGTLYINLTGGEALTRHDICELLAYAKAHGMLVSLLTNATLVTPEKADRLAALGLYRVDVSLYGATAATYEAVTRVPGSFAKFVRGLDLLLERQIPVRLKTMVLTTNVHDIEAMREFAESRGLHFEYCSDVRPKADGDPEPLQFRITPEQSVELYKTQVLDRQQPATSNQQPAAGTPSFEETCKMPGTGGGLFECGCGKSSCGISPYGEMNLCVSYHAPQCDVKHGRVAEGWQALTHFVDAQRPTEQFECPTCPVYHACTKVASNVYLEHGDFNACSAYHKRVAELTRDLLAPHA